MNERRIIQIAISSIGIGLITIHITWPDIKVDYITICLFIIIIIPWLAPIIKSFELPGGFKVEYPEIALATRKLEDAGLIQPYPPYELHI